MLMWRVCSSLVVQLSSTASGTLVYLYIWLGNFWVLQFAYWQTPCGRLRQITRTRATCRPRSKFRFGHGDFRPLNLSPFSPTHRSIVGWNEERWAPCELQGVPRGKVEYCIKLTKLSVVHYVGACFLYSKLLIAIAKTEVRCSGYVS